MYYYCGYLMAIITIMYYELLMGIYIYIYMNGIEWVL